MNADCSKMGDPESETHRVTTIPTYILTYIHCKCKHGPLWSYFPFHFFYLTEIPHLRSWSEPTSDWLTGLTEPLLPVANLAPTVAARSSSTMIPGRIRRQSGPSTSVHDIDPSSINITRNTRIIGDNYCNSCSGTP